MATLKLLFEKLASLSSDDGFLSFQNLLVQNFYDSLGQGYSRAENEVALVKRLVEVANGKSYGPIKLCANMLHGTRSYVEFNYLDKPVTKELGDMAVVSLITSGNCRVFQRTCIIQNKKSVGKGWDIDLEQLFLLKNFPPFSGNKGMFRGRRELTFRNSSGCLGAFGLLESPGEMTLLAAPRIAQCLQGKKSLAPSDLATVAEIQQNSGDSLWSGFPLWPEMLHFHPKEWFFFMEEFSGRYGFPPFSFGGAGGLPFLRNATVLLDLYDFAKAWTQFNLGEVSCVQDSITNKTVDAFSNFLIRSAGFGDIAAFPGDNIFGDAEFRGQMAVFVMHMDLNREG